MKDDKIILISISLNELKEIIRDTIYHALSDYTERNPLKSERLNYTKREAAAELSCSITMIDKLIKKGELNTIKLGAKVLIPREGITRILLNKKQKHHEI